MTNKGKCNSLFMLHYSTRRLDNYFN